MATRQTLHTHTIVGCVFEVMHSIEQWLVKNANGTFKDILVKRSSEWSLLFSNVSSGLRTFTIANLKVWELAGKKKKMG